MCISALMPLLAALAGKVNFVTWVTGASYAELNIFHRYVGGVVFALATIHTVPHIVAPIKDGGGDYMAQLFIAHKRELSGVILYFIFLVMMVLSVPWVRRRFYEFFAFTHIILGMAFFGVLWWHIKGEYASPIYIYSTVGIFVLSNLLRIVHRNRSFLRGNPLCKCGWEGALGGFPTKFEQLPGNITKVTVDVPASMRWKPGRHSYIRMPRIAVFGNHPFTVASIPSTSPNEPNQLVFLIRAHAGFTRSLAQSAALHQPPSPVSSPPISTLSSTSNVPLLMEKQQQQLPALSDLEAQRPRHPLSSTPHAPIRTIVDGTYGTYTGPLHRTFDTVVLIAAGTGITAALPHALDLAARMRDAALLPPANPDHCAVRDIRLVWTVRDEAWVGWVRRELELAVSNANEGASRARAWKGASGARSGVVPGRIVVDVYVTGKRETPAATPMASQASIAPPPQQQQQQTPVTRPAQATRTSQAEGLGIDASSAVEARRLCETPAPAPPYYRDYVFTPAARAQVDRSRWSSAEIIRISDDGWQPSACSSLYSQCGLVGSPPPPPPSQQQQPQQQTMLARAASRALFGACQCCRHRSLQEGQRNINASSLNVKYERPVVRELLPRLITSLRGGRAFVMGCGPEGLKIELGNAVAGMQARVASGEMERVVLHMETFGW
ncbi:putative ferric reductase protein [Neofusicoccum parvum]|uniref:Ferric reductase protein n=1 Tax=Neofusicoccum parvum TaxID=310453 RepID=A0ACB5SEU0_9PEZI|nr:putative ferric reductase protein [Neofusicoccum parvum]